MRHIFVINPVAGKGKAEKLIPEIKKCFNKTNQCYNVVQTEYAHHATEIVKQEALKGGNVRFYACGGDGTLFDVVNGAVGFANVEVGAIPCGSGNDFIKSFGSKEEFLNIKGQIYGSAIPVDLIKYQDKYSINICSMGMDAEVVNYKNNNKWLKKINGSVAYVFSLFIAFVFKIKNKFTITIDNHEPLSGTYLFAIAANGKYYGGGFKPAPDALVNDSLLDVVLVKAVSRFKIVKLLSKFRKGTHVNLSEVCSVHRAHRLMVESDREMSVNMDGEIFRHKQAVFEVVKNGVKFIVPNVITVKTEEDAKSKKSSVVVNAPILNNSLKS